MSHLQYDDDRFLTSAVLGGGHSESGGRRSPVDDGGVMHALLPRPAKLLFLEGEIELSLTSLVTELMRIFNLAPKALCQLVG